MAVTSPPSYLQICLHTDRPIPLLIWEELPLEFVLFVNGVKILSSWSGFRPTPLSLTETQSCCTLSLNIRTYGITVIIPFVEYLTAFEIKLRSTCCNLLLSNFANLGITFIWSTYSSIFKFLKLSVVFIRSIISLIALISDPEVILRVNLPFCMILWSRRSFACNSTI